MLDLPPLPWVCGNVICAGERLLNVKLEAIIRDTVEPPCHGPVEIVAICPLAAVVPLQWLVIDTVQRQC